MYQCIIHQTIISAVKLRNILVDSPVYLENIFEEYGNVRGENFSKSFQLILYKYSSLEEILSEGFINHNIFGAHSMGSLPFGTVPHHIQVLIAHL